MGARMDAKLAIYAHKIAIGRRKPEGALLYHSDQACQYASRAHQQVFEKSGFQPSMSRTGNCYGNVCVESFFSTLKNELVLDRRYRTRDEVRRDVFEYIETFCNPKRLHQPHGCLNPVDFEKLIGVA